MKSFLITLLIIGSAFLVYDYWLTPPWQRLVFERAAPPAVPVTPVAVEEADVPVIPPPAPVPVPKSDYVPRIPEIATTEFVPPVIPSLEDLTAGWTKIPAQAFPRQVTLKVPVDVKMAVGAARLPAGSTAYAYGENGGRLTVGPTSESPARGSVALTETDLPDQLRTSYAQWKTARIEQARRAWQARKTAKPINTNMTSHVMRSELVTGKSEIRKISSALRTT